MTVELSDDVEIDFADNVLKTATRFDERNLMHCKFLNLKDSSILQIDTMPLGALQVLILA